MELEREFCCDALSVALVGMNADMMSRYIEFVADRLLVVLGYPKLYNVANPFDWMDMISLQCVPRVLVERGVSSCRAPPPPLARRTRPPLLPPSPPHTHRGKTNFFERRVGEYQRAGVMQSVSGAARKYEHVFSLEEDF